MRSIISGAVAILAAGAVLAAAVQPASAATASAPDSASGATYLVGQLTDGNHLETTYDGSTYVDDGGTADLGFALAAAGGHDTTLAAVVGFLIKDIDNYADISGQYGGPYTGSVAKLALLAEVTGQNPRAFAGQDLLKILTDNVCTAAIAGDYSPCTAAGDFRNAGSPVSQALGILALARAEVTPPVATVTRLLQLQCADGGFSSTFIDAGATCTSDVDTTGYAISALSLLPTAAVDVQHAVTYLRGAAQPDGGFVGASGENSNSTALAVLGLLAADQVQPLPAANQARPAATPTDPTVVAALGWLGGAQNSNGGFPVNKGGASDARASTQAVLAAGLVPLTRLSHPVVLAAPPTSSSPTTGSTPTASTAPTSAAPSASASTTGAAAAASGSTTAALANTGTRTASWLALATGALLLGSGLVLLGHRRRALPRHR